MKKIFVKEVVLGLSVVTILLITLVIGGLNVASSVSAQVNPNPSPTGGINPNPQQPLTNARFENPLKVGSVEQLIFALVDIALQLGVVVAALALIWVGFMYVAARGNPDKISDAHHALFYTVVGIAVLFGSKVIVEIIKQTIAPIAPGVLGR